MSNKQSTFIVWLFLLFGWQGVSAHQLSDSYLKLVAPAEQSTLGYSARWHLGLKDLEMAVGIDQNKDGEITWGEVLSRENSIKRYAASSLVIFQNDQVCPVNWLPIQMDSLNSGVFIALDFVVLCTVESALTAEYKPFFEFDQSHRGILTYIHGTEEQVIVIGPDNTMVSLSNTPRSSFLTFVHFIKDGVWHIWIGFDHILFLVALLLPSVLFRRNHRWQAQEQAKPVVIDVLKVVTTFTVAHSVTLIAATLNWVSLPTSLVETIIALSVGVAGLHLLYPVAHHKRWLFAFVFGLIHGFGFASVLSDLNLPTQSFWASILGFNLGVEIGQLVIVFAILPLLFIVRRSVVYQEKLIPVGAVSMIFIASVWVVERGF